MKIAVLGAGAMGCLYGGRLKQAGEDVTLIDVNQPHMDAINQNGLQITYDDGEARVEIPACRAEDYNEKPDLIIVFTKSTFSESAVASLAHAIGEATYMLSLQNGLGHERIMGKYVNPDHIIIGTTNFPSDLLDHGVIAIHGAGVTRMMTVTQKVDGQVEAIHDALKRAGMNPELTEDVFQAIWEKVAFNAAMNSLTAVTHLPQGYLGQTREGNELAHQIVEEVLSVAQKKGIRTNGDHVHETVENLFRDHFEHCPSMFQDVLKKRVTEIEAINGAVVREAKELGVEVPATKVMYQLVSICQQTYPYRKDSI